jgi:hypothetical protein
MGEMRCGAFQPKGPLPACHNAEEGRAAAFSRTNRRTSECQKFTDRPDPDIGITVDATFAINTTVCDGSVVWSTSSGPIYLE